MYRCLSALTLYTQFISGSNHFPFFHETERNITVRTGDLAILKCTIENLGPKMVSSDTLNRRLDAEGRASNIPTRVYP